MRVVVVGLGRVGSVVTACLLRDRHTVVGVDTDPSIAAAFAGGSVPFYESEVAELIAAGHKTGRFTVATDSYDAIADADIVLVCVPTSGLSDGLLDLSRIKRAASGLGAALRLRSLNLPAILLVFRSTMLPGSMTGTVLPEIAAAAGEIPGARYEVAYNPEFMREGSAIADYLAPSRIVIGERQKGTAQRLMELYDRITAPVFWTTLETAELAKFTDNSFHALKIAFANEIGRLAIRAGIPPTTIFDIFVSDTKLNLSSSYLRPGGAFGGPCLPKDVLALAAAMRAAGIDAPVIEQIIPSNSLHTDFLVTEIERRASTGSRILLVGLTFKAGTDDLRESQLITLAKRLLAGGYDLSIYDPDLIDEASAEINQRALTQIPSELSSMMLSKLPSLDWDLILLGKKHPDVERVVGLKSRVLKLYELEFDARTNSGS
jgi:GDP-mannose 6-dehydrogenase